MLILSKGKLTSWLREASPVPKLSITTFTPSAFSAVSVFKTLEKTFPLSRARRACRAYLETLLKAV